LILNADNQAIIFDADFFRHQEVILARPHLFSSAREFVPLPQRWWKDDFQPPFRSIKGLPRTTVH
jgi:hypothetical protein